MDKDQVADWLERLAVLVDEGDEVLEASYTNEIEPTETCGVYAEVVCQIKHLVFLRGELEGMVARIMDADLQAVDYLGGAETKVLKKSASKPRRNWDNDGLLTAVRKRIVADAIDSGADESVIPTVQSTVDSLGTVYRLAGSNVRTTALKDLYIDADEYCESSDYRFSVAVV
jgi:hypothetical protein